MLAAEAVLREAMAATALASEGAGVTAARVGTDVSRVPDPSPVAAIVTAAEGSWEPVVPSLARTTSAADAGGWLLLVANSAGFSSGSTTDAVAGVTSSGTDGAAVDPLVAGAPSTVPEPAVAAAAGLAGLWTTGGRRRGEARRRRRPKR